MIRLIATLICLTLMSPVMVAAEPITGLKFPIDGLVQRNGLYFKKFTDTPFSGELKGGRFQGKFKDGRQVGIWASFSDNGQLRLKGNYENGKAEGEWLLFEETGELVIRANYKHGKKAGKWLTYFKTGQVAVEKNYQNDLLDGKRIEYWNGNPPGRIFYESNYKLGEKQGPSTSYWLNGNLESKAFYKSGKLNGPFIEYFENGKDIKAKGNYVDGKRDGYWEFFDAPGKKRLGDKDGFGDKEAIEYMKSIGMSVSDLLTHEEGSGVYKDGKKISP